MSQNSQPSPNDLLGQISQSCQQLQQNLQTQLQQSTGEVEKLERHEQKLQSQVSESEAKLASYKELTEQAIADLELITKQQPTEQAKLDRLTKEFAEVSRRLSTLKQDSVSEQHLASLARADVATRTQALDEREAILKRREQAVARLESQVQESAQLLNL